MSDHGRVMNGRKLGTNAVGIERSTWRHATCITPNRVRLGEKKRSSGGAPPTALPSLTRWAKELGGEDARVTGTGAAKGE